ncbi:tyrosine-protein phosphatase [Agromyces sp. SYSU T00194]|uniref:tyrosine-protein phosphatase n=1 Tax=Agromyces chitinivorans TaxID=3158560 RepID=UPI00339348B9
MNASTRLDIPGTVNFREVGPLPAATGTVREGVLFRSDALHALGDPGRQALRDLGVGIVIDLRDEYEVANRPDDLDGLDVELLRLPVFEGSGASAGQPGITLDALYARIVTQHTGVVIDALREIARADGRSVIVHCTAGKDRTGVVTALALLAVGVDRDLVLDDYASTEQYLAGPWLEQMVAMLGEYGVADSPGLRMLMGGSPREALASALDLIDHRHGSTREYLLAGGLTLDELAALERVLVRGD